MATTLNHHDMVSSLHPVLYCKLNNTTTSTAESYYGADGTYYNTPTAEGTSPVLGDSGSAHFNKANDEYAVVTADLSGNAIAFGGWFRTKAAYTGLRVLLGTVLGGTNYTSINFTSSSGELVVDAAGTADDMTYTWGSHTDDTWFHVMVSVSSTTRFLYLNGVQVASDVSATALAFIPSDWNIGRYTTTTNYADLDAAHIVLFNTGLTSGNVSDLYASRLNATALPAKPTFGDTSLQETEYFDPAPISVYLYNKGSGTTVTNHSSGVGADLTPLDTQVWAERGLDFIGTQDALIVGSGNALGLTATNGLTFQVKFRDRTYVNPSTMRLCGIHRATGSTLFGLDLITGALRFGVYDGVGFKSYTYSTTQSATATVCFGAGTVKCFVDGVLVNSFAYAHTTAFSLLNSYKMVVGAYDTDSSGVDSVIEHTYILPHTLSDAEAIDLATNPYRLVQGGVTPPSFNLFLKQQQSTTD